MQFAKGDGNTVACEKIRRLEKQRKTGCGNYTAEEPATVTDLAAELRLALANCDQPGPAYILRLAVIAPIHRVIQEAAAKRNIILV